MCWRCASLVYIFAGWVAVWAPRGGEGQVGAVGRSETKPGSRGRRLAGQQARVSQYYPSESEERASFKGPISASLIRQKWKKLGQPDSELLGGRRTVTTGSHDRKHNLPLFRWRRKNNDKQAGNCFIPETACLKCLL